MQPRATTQNIFSEISVSVSWYMYQVLSITKEQHQASLISIKQPLSASSNPYQHQAPLISTTYQHQASLTSIKALLTSIKALLTCIKASFTIQHQSIKYSTGKTIKHSTTLFFVIILDDIENRFLFVLHPVQTG